MVAKPYTDPLHYSQEKPISVKRYRRMSQKSASNDAVKRNKQTQVDTGFAFLAQMFAATGQRIRIGDDYLR